MRTLLLITLIAACTDEASVETRTCNRTGFEIAALLPWTDEVVAVRANESCTPYQISRDAYPYTGASFLIGNDRFEYEPVDFVGQELLPPGRWTYEVRIVNYAQRTVSTHAVEDRP
jgi:hypothetical protein